MDRARLATSMHLQGELAPALREARRGVQLDPQCVDCRLVLATVYAARAELTEAETELRRVLEQSPGNPYALNALANVYLAMGRPADAQPLAEQAAGNEDYDGRHLAFYNLGRSYIELDRATEALEAFGRSIRENPRMCLARYAIAGVYVRQSRFDQAVEQLQLAIGDQSPDGRPESTAPEQRIPSCNDMPDTHELLGIALLGAGRDEEAIQAFRRCAELAPEGNPRRQSCAERAEQQGPDADSGSVPED